MKLNISRIIFLFIYLTLKDPTPTFTQKELVDFWRILFDNISKINNQGVMEKDGSNCLTALGLICLHCMKLLTKTPESTQKSMTARMNNHFVDLYKLPGVKHKLVPVHIKSLTSLAEYMRANQTEALEIVSILVGKTIIEGSKLSSDQAVKGVLYGSCLTHIGMYGLGPVKHVEQTALALGLKTSEFCRLICTKHVKASLENVCSLIGESTKMPGKQKILDAEYDLKMQLSWRFCRLYNQAHFQRFKTQQNARLIIRCAAYLSETSRGTEIKHMTLLDSRMNKTIFEHEKAKAHKYLSSRLTMDDEPLTAEAKAIYKKSFQDPSDPF